MSLSNRLNVLIVLMWIPLGVIMGVAISLLAGSLDSNPLAGVLVPLMYLGAVIIAIGFRKLVLSAIKKTPQSSVRWFMLARSPDRIEEMFLNELIKDYEHAERRFGGIVVAKERNLSVMTSEIEQILEDFESLDVSSPVRISRMQADSDDFSKQIGGLVMRQPGSSGLGKAGRLAARISEEYAQTPIGAAP